MPNYQARMGTKKTPFPRSADRKHDRELYPVDAQSVEFGGR